MSPKKQTIKFRKINKKDITKLVKDMNLDSIAMNNLEEFVDQLEKNMQPALDKNTPEITKNIVARKKVPWVTDGNREQKKIIRRENFWQKYRKTISGLNSKMNTENIEIC